MRLKHIEISGFRGFASKQSLDLSADAIVVVGSNGLGKTSILDAIHWGLSGRLSRLGVDDHNLVSLYSNTGQARVVLTLVNADSEMTITRVFDGKTQSVRAVLGKEEFKETSAKARILETLWPEAASAKDGDESLSLALVRSVYLQQDRLREFLESSSDQDRFNVISELVGAGRLTELQAQLESESRSWSIATTRMEREVAPLAERVEVLMAQLETLKKSAAVGHELKESQWVAWWKSFRELDKSNSNIPTPTSPDASNAIDSALKELTALRDRNRRKRGLVEQTIDALEKPPTKPPESIAALESKLARATDLVVQAKKAMEASQLRAGEFRKRQLAANEENEQRRALAQLALQLLAEKCPVCQQSYDVEKTRLRLEEIIGSVELSKPIEELEPIGELAAKENEAVQNEIVIRRNLSEANQLQERYEQWRQVCQSKLTELEIPERGDAKEELKGIQRLCDGLESLFEDQLMGGEALAFSLARESASARVTSTSVELESAKNELKEQRRILQKREQATATTKRLIEQLREARSKVAIEKLAEIEPLLQRIFARIDPHPTFRVVKFATNVIRGKGRLDAEVHDSIEDRSSKNPEVIFSSSQLNALAVSVFLSFNLALPNLPLQTALLDDPIQSLDDINLLGLVDLLRRVKEKRQIVVSTHDQKFGRLLARKLRPASNLQSTSVIELRGWERTGPKVFQYPVEADTVPLLMASRS